MAARLAPTNWLLLGGLMGLSVMVGLLAGVNPKFAIAFSLGVGFVLLVFVDLTAGLAAFAFLSFLELLNAGSVVSIGKLAGVLLALGWLAFLVNHQDAKADFFAVHPGISMVLGLFLGWVLLSALWAESTSVVLTTFARFLPNVILFLIVFTAIRDRRAALMVVSGFLLGAVAAAFYGLLFAQTAVQDYGGRLTGSNLDPNELASMLVAGMALSVGLAANLRGKPGPRLAVLAAGGICLLTSMLTGSRGGLVSLAAMVIVGIVFGGRWRGRIALGGAVVAVIVVFYIAALAPPQIRQRIQQSDQGQERVFEGRTTLWEIGKRMVEAHPVTGVGAGNFQTSSRHYLLQPGAVFRSDVVIFTPQVAHNTYLGVAAELGLVGLTLFLTITGFSLFSLIRAAGNFARRGDLRSEALTRAMLVAMVGVLVADFFISQEINKQLWLMLGIGPALLAISKRSGANDARAA
jgi:putative inorganic carbon (HCO3(-)) transporter